MIKFCLLNRKYKLECFFFLFYLSLPPPLSVFNSQTHTHAPSFSISLTFAHHHLWCWYIKTIASACINSHLHNIYFIIFGTFVLLSFPFPFIECSNNIINILKKLSAFRFPSIFTLCRLDCVCVRMFFHLTFQLQGEIIGLTFNLDSGKESKEMCFVPTRSEGIQHTHPLSFSTSVRKLNYFNR